MASQQQEFKINNIQFNGVKRTNVGLLKKILSSTVTKDNITDAISDLREQLTYLDVFKEVEITGIKTSPNEDYDIIVIVKEHKRLTGSINTILEGNATSVTPRISTTAKLPNITGQGDNLKAQANFNQSYLSFNTSYSVPIDLSKAHNASLNITSWDPTPSNYDQRQKSFTNNLVFKTGKNSYHKLGLELGWRELRCTNESTPHDVRLFSGHSLKTSLKHEFIFDNRDNGYFSHKGFLFKIASEVAPCILENSTCFSRHELITRCNFDILRKLGWLVQVNFSTGLLYPKTASIMDRFFIGGPCSFRGFKVNGLGPSTRGFPLGCDAYALGGFHVYPTLPFKHSENISVRPQMFVNLGLAGLWENLKYPNSFAMFKRSLEENSRLSAGVGIVGMLGPVRLELNYSLVLKKLTGDLEARGFQFGASMDF